MRALPISVYKSNSSDCTNGGITSKYSSLLLVCEDGFIEVDETNPPENLVKVVTRKLFGKEYKHIEPYARPTELGWMAGGNLAYTCDSRFPSDYPLSVHDRQETQELYNMLSE